MRGRMLFLILLIINTTTFTGCWNYREINQLSIVAGMAVDKSETGKYILTVEIVDLHEGGRDTRIKSKLLEIEGDTLFDAVRNAVKITALRLYFGQMEILIISQEIAREGVFELVDILSRNAEPRLTIDLLVSKEKTANEILNSQSITTEIRSYEINDMLDAQKILSKTSKVEIYQFINALPCEGIYPVLPCVHLTETAGLKTSELSGTAVFKGDKLIGFLDEEETKYFSFITDKIKGGLLILKNSPDENNINISLEIYENKTKVKPVYSDGKVSIRLETKTRVVFAEQGTRENFMNESGRLMLEKDAGELLKTNITKVIQKVQKDFGVDIFGFGSIVNADMPDLWKEIGYDWNTVFKDMEVNVNTTIEIQNSGLLSKPIKVGA